MSRASGCTNEIINEASTNAAQLPIQKFDDARNIIINPSAETAIVGDTVFLVNLQKRTRADRSLPRRQQLGRHVGDRAAAGRRPAGVALLLQLLREERASG